jgi:adenylyltransferase/sulfurtransferase
MLFPPEKQVASDLSGQSAVNSTGMSDVPAKTIGRYDRQIIFGALGAEGHRRLRQARALVVGAGGLGCTVADLLSRAGVGILRLVDDDRVSLENLHRQTLFDQDDAAARRPKVEAARRRIALTNSDVQVEAVVARLAGGNAESLAADCDAIIDATDNFAARFIINDLCVMKSLPWVFAGVVGAEAQALTIVPPGTPCLRCVVEALPPPCEDPTCRQAGVLGPAVVAIAAMQALEAIKILSGRLESVSPYLTKFDFWGNAIQRIDVVRAGRRADCPCCGRRDFEFLHG